MYMYFNTTKWTLFSLFFLISVISDIITSIDFTALETIIKDYVGNQKTWFMMFILKSAEN